MYTILYGLLYLFSLLPLRLLYLVSDFAYFVLYKIWGYRKDVVRQNLIIAFPEKTEAARNQIEKQFYRNFTDNFIETLKLISGGPSFAAKHFNADGRLMQEQFEKGHRCQFHLGHNFNWEFANIAVTGISPYKMLMVYLPVQNKVFERLMLKVRTASGNHLLSAKNMKNDMLPHRNSLYLLALIADQVPGDVSKAYWLNFFGRPTPFLRGPERGAAAGNLSVFFAQIYKTKRGMYQLDYELCTENAADLPKGELTRRYAGYLECSISEHPEMWLWTHRRWKREWKNEYEKLWIGQSPPPAASSVPSSL